MNKKLLLSVCLTFIFSVLCPVNDVVRADDTVVSSESTVTPVPTVTPEPTMIPEFTATPVPTVAPEVTISESTDVSDSNVSDDSETSDTYYHVGGYDEDGNWVGFVDGLKRIENKLELICWHLECIVAFCLILVVFGTWKIVRSWSKGVNIK